MKKILIGFVIGFTIWACGTESTSRKTGSETADGKSIFKSYCVTCHGMDGRMQMNGAKDLTLSQLSLEERISIITNGKNTMASFKPLLSPREIEAVAQYTIQLGN